MGDYSVPVGIICLYNFGYLLNILQSGLMLLSLFPYVIKYPSELMKKFQVVFYAMSPEIRGEVVSFDLSGMRYSCQVQNSGQNV